MKIMRCQLAAVLVLILAVPVLAADDHRLVEAAKKAYEAKAAAYESGLTNDVEALYSWSRRWMEAELHSAAKEDDRIAAYTAHLDRMKPLAEKIAVRMQAGARGGTPDNQDAANYFVAEAKTWVRNSKADPHEPNR